MFDPIPMAEAERALVASIKPAMPPAVVIGFIKARRADGRNVEPNPFAGLYGNPGARDAVAGLGDPFGGLFKHARDSQ